MSGEEVAAFTDREPSGRAAAILDGVTVVVGPVSNDEGRALHRAFDW